LYFLDLFKTDCRCEKENHFLPAGLLISLTDKSLPTVAYFSVAEVADIIFIIFFPP